MIYGGHKDKNGKISSFGHLSFDNYDQDQTVVIQNLDNPDGKSSWIGINDQPMWDQEELFKLDDKVRALPKAQRHRAYQQFFATHSRSKHRAYLGTDDDHSSDLILMDPEGRPRIVAKVAADGSPVLQFLDADGKVVQQLPQAASH